MKKGSIEAMQVKEFTGDFINWALDNWVDSMEFIVKHYDNKKMRYILDSMLKQMIDQFMNIKN